MKRILPAILLVIVALSGFVAKESLRIIPNESFSAGELLKYKIHYGPITAAEAVIDIAPNLHRINDRPTYKATVYGRTTNSFDLFVRIRDTWQSYIDTAAILPQRSFRNIEEGNYRKRETVDFNHFTNMAQVESSKKDKNKKQSAHKIPHGAQDIVSGFYFLRTLDYDSYQVGDKFSIKGFFDEETFDMVVTYQGRETVNTKSGTYKAIKLVPRMPKNKIFKGEDAITVYLSDDKNKIPVMISANMFVGSVKVDLYEHKNLKHRPALVAQK